jgi:YidC/Oxa1 family membrane protein insertase
LEQITPIWNAIIVHPLMDGLRFLAALTGSGGIAIIVFTIAIRTLMLPLSIYQMRSQKAMTAVQPLVREAQQKFGKDRERVTQETMRIYKEHGVNPASGCLPLVIQMPIFIGLYNALIQLANSPEEPMFHSQSFLWLPSLGAADPMYVMPILTGVSQLVLQRMMTQPSSDPQQQMMNRMMTFMPLVFLGVTFSLPAGLVMYWVVSNAVSMVQQYFTTGWGSLFPLLPPGLLGGEKSDEGSGAVGAKKPKGNSGGGSNGRALASPSGDTEGSSDGTRAPASGRGGAKSSGKRKRGGKR